MIFSRLHNEPSTAPAVRRAEMRAIASRPEPYPWLADDELDEVVAEWVEPQPDPEWPTSATPDPREEAEYEAWCQRQDHPHKGDSA